MFSECSDIVHYSKVLKLEIKHIILRLLLTDPFLVAFSLISMGPMSDCHLIPE